MITQVVVQLEGKICECAGDEKRIDLNSFRERLCFECLVCHDTFELDFSKIVSDGRRSQALDRESGGRDRQRIKLPHHSKVFTPYDVFIMKTIGIHIDPDMIT